MRRPSRGLGSLGAGVLLVCAAAWVSTLWFSVALNMSHSLPGTLYVIHKHSGFQRGDLAAYRWHGGAGYPRGTIFIKQVAGLPGDTVRRVGSKFWVDDRAIGVAKPTSNAGRPLQPSASGVIAANDYFMATPHPDSLDSRYALSGNIPLADIIGKAYEIF